MLVSEFDFDLPEEQIAQQPPHDRSAARMLSLSREAGDWRDGWFREFPETLRPGDLLVLNDSRVIPARLFGQRAPRAGAEAREPSGRIEALLTEQASEWEWWTELTAAVMRAEGKTGCESARFALRLQVSVVECT